jgi:hypothetical protein
MIDMAGNLPLANGVQCKLTWTWQGNPHALNILHFAGPLGNTIDQTIANTIDGSIKSALTSSGLLADLATGYALQNVSTRSMTNNSDPWYVGAGAPVAGSSIENPLPAAVSFVVTLRTGLRGRSYQGRVYLAGFSEGANDTLGGITALASGHATAFIDGIRVGMVTGTPSLTMGVVSRFTTIPPATTAIERNPPVINSVTGIVAMDLRWDTQRRRATPGV